MWRDLGSGRRRYIRVRTKSHAYPLGDVDAGVRMYERNGFAMACRSTRSRSSRCAR